MKKIGWYLMSILPVAVMLLIQFVGSVVLMVWYMLCYGVADGAQMALDNLMGIMVVTQVMTLFVTGLWYYFGVFRQRAGRKEEERGAFFRKLTGGYFLSCYRSTGSDWNTASSLEYGESGAD